MLIQMEFESITYTTFKMSLVGILIFGLMHLLREKYI